MSKTKPKKKSDLPTFDPFTFEDRYVTPDEARRMMDRALEVSDGNIRHTSRAYVREMAADMLCGQWVANGEPVIVNCNGAIPDGWHRLEAVVEAGIPVRLQFIHGVPMEAAETIDQGRRRTITQILQKAGSPSKHVTMAVQGWQAMREGKDPFRHLGRRVDFRQARLLYGRNLETFNWVGSMMRRIALQFGTSNNRKALTIRAGQFGPCLILSGLTRGISFAEGQVDKLCAPNPPRDRDPMNALALKLHRIQRDGFGFSARLSGYYVSTAFRESLLGEERGAWREPDSPERVALPTIEAMHERFALRKNLKRIEMPDSDIPAELREVVE